MKLSSQGYGEDLRSEEDQKYSKIIMNVYFHTNNGKDTVNRENNGGVKHHCD